MKAKLSCTYSHERAEFLAGVHVLDFGKVKRSKGCLRKTITLMARTIHTLNVAIRLGAMSESSKTLSHNEGLFWGLYLGSSTT